MSEADERTEEREVLRVNRMWLFWSGKICKGRKIRQA